MKYLLPGLSVTVLLLLLVPHASASTSIDVSGNGDGSHTSVSVHSSTGGNYVNGKEVSGSNGTSTTTVTVNGKTYVNESTEGTHDTDISVKAEGNKEPEVKYEVNKKSVSTNGVKKEVKDIKAADKKKIEALKSQHEVKLNKIAAIKKEVHEETLLARLESLFTSLREIFSK
jgi:hypothetical protein